MNINDIIALAKSGYKKKDIDELLKMETPKDPEPIPEEPLPESPERDPEQEQPEPEEKEGDDDIKEQINRANLEIADLKAKLAKAQAQNVRKNIDDGRDAAADRDARIADYARRLM